ncbi:sensor histidine kinase [Nocardioides xinjiangensis]|uniref:sensor histidine kinase n=1 Tax=Nocardioides xinjiangensis TaxID=2817376 RepID=UPI001B316380|nr:MULTISPECIES: histidine kinase [unclassified Nocardioides]
MSSSPAALPGIDGLDRRTPRVPDVVLGLLVLAGTLVKIDEQQSWTVVAPKSSVEFLIFVTAAAAFAARTFPVPALVVASVLDAVPHWLPIGGAGYHLSFMICLYMVSAYSGRRTVQVAVAVVFVVQVGLMAWVLDWRWGHLFIAVTALSVVLPTALGAATRARHAALLAMRARAEEAERSRHSEARKLLAEDRLRVARDLHDSVAHQIAVMNLNTAVASSALPDRPEDASRALLTVREAGRSVIDSISDLLRGLREESWDDLEPSYTSDELTTLVEEFRTLIPSLDVEPDLGTDARPVSAVTYLVVRECLTNAYKHGDHQAPIELALHRGAGTFSLRVSNTTREPTSDFVEGFGLRGMRERVAAAGGRLEVSCADRTFVVSAEVPEEAGAT